VQSGQNRLWSLLFLCRLTFDFVLGVSGAAIVPASTVPHVSRFLTRVYLHRDDVLTAFKDVFGSLDRHQTMYTSSNVIVRRGGTLKSWRLVCSNAEQQWGLPSLCGNATCTLGNGITFQTRKPRRGDGQQDYAKAICKRCGWASPWLARPAWVTPLGNYHFLHEYPLTEGQVDYIRSQMAPSVDNLA
jgi:hypothetical protein